MENTKRESEQYADVLRTARSVCHEMKQPLMISLGFLELLMLDARDRSETTDKLEKIYAQTYRLSELTNKLMNIIPKME